MNSPYKKRLEELKNCDAVIHRANAEDLKGKVLEVDDGGCYVATEGSDSEHVLNVFVAYEDIRGVGAEDWDYEVIS